MNTLKTLILIVALLLANTLLFAQDESKDVTITASGSGTTLEDAQQAALRSATEQAFGAFISSKTEMFNDQVVADQMASVSSGNIKSFEILNKDQLPDGRWGVTLKAIVSVDKLTSFAQAKGVEIEFKGGLFALNIKQQLLNEQGEIQAVAEMVGLLHEPMQVSFDYVIKSSDPKSVDSESKNWEIPLVVTATCNKNIDFCGNYLKKTLAALSLSQAEVESYKLLNKSIFTVNFTFKNQSVVYYLRKYYSICAIRSLISNWGFYVNLFEVNSGMDLTYGSGRGNIVEFGSGFNYVRHDDGSATINFPSIGNIVGTFNWFDKRTLSQIEQMTSYSVRPRGVVSFFKNGGYIVEEIDGHGIVMSLFDLGYLNWFDAQNKCEDLILNGYNDWYLPSQTELGVVEKNVFKLNIGNINKSIYWSSTVRSQSYAEVFIFSNGGNYTGPDKTIKYFVRAIRRF